MLTPERPRSRKDACTPKSAGWTLYNPEDVAEKLNKPLSEVDRVLEETGFNKAVRIREEVIRWKTGLIIEQKQLASEEDKLRQQLKNIKGRQHRVSEMLCNIRNILRIPREKEVYHANT